jgi:glutathione synthase/RimK-type ligase-like ATP-grasp enzyme
MILLCGIPSEPPLALVAKALDESGAPHLFFNQRQFANAAISFEIMGGRAVGSLQIDGAVHDLDDIAGVYTRLMDYRRLPELAGVPESADAFRYCAALNDTLARWCEISDARVVNRMAPMGSNSSKPYQAQLIRRYGFYVPATLVTNNAEQVLAFREHHKRIIYKSISGVRSIVQTFEDTDMARFPALRWCPTQFQQYVEGYDVRVHVVDKKVFATKINSNATDYRYARTQAGEAAELTAMDIPDNVAQGCINLAAGLGLAFAGIDLKFAPEGEVYCFEVNPSPGYSYFEANSGQPIAQAVADYLIGTA